MYKYRRHCCPTCVYVKYEITVKAHSKDRVMENIPVRLTEVKRYAEDSSSSQWLSLQLRMYAINPFQRPGGQY